MYLINNFNCVVLLFFGGVGDTSFTSAIDAVFPRYLFFIFFRVTKENFIVFNKICHLKPTVQQLWSNAHQHVKISIIMNCTLFYFTLSIYLKRINFRAYEISPVLNFAIFFEKFAKLSTVELCRYRKIAKLNTREKF